MYGAIIYDVKYLSDFYYSRFYLLDFTSLAKFITEIEIYWFHNVRYNNTSELYGGHHSEKSYIDIFAVSGTCLFEECRKRTFELTHFMQLK